MGAASTLAVSAMSGRMNEVDFMLSLCSCLGCLSGVRSRLYEGLKIC
jgi:hypothetical protein